MSTALPTPPRRRLTAGEVIVEVVAGAVSNAADVKKRIDQLKKDGKKSVLLLVSNAEGELRFVALECSNNQVIIAGLDPGNPRVCESLF